MADRTVAGASLVELLDRLIETGVAASGDLILGLADVDLVRVSVQLVLGSVDELGDGTRPASPEPPAVGEPPAVRNEGAGQPAAGAPGPPARERPGSSLSEREPPEPGQPEPGQPEPGQPEPGQPEPGLPELGLSEPGLSELGDAHRGIGALLVAVVELVRQLMERQAIHRMERGSLTPEQVERLGRALHDLDHRVGQLIEVFGTRPAEQEPRAAPVRTATV